ncbi:histidine phosphatase family protein [Psychroserpens sp. AS72]|uniref:SixA phosphatase family protein n=1 Tax=Psychroserpens sp. AS72 TaxID=3135775 RepID=UPI003178B072
MKTLVLVRHAKSSWEHNVGDKKRPLKKRGKNDATLVSIAFKNRELVLDKVYSSPANRALSTCKIFINNLNFDNSKLAIVDELYDFGGEQVINFLKTIDVNYQNIMIFGHNHAFTSICNIFGNSFIDNLPTSGLVVIDFDIKTWEEINKGNTRFTIFPRDLK